MSGFIQADAARLPFADGTFDLTFTSPPYSDARTYGIGAQRDCASWIAWMLDVVAECVRVTKGLVLVNCAGVTRKWCYQPGPEGLLYEWWKRGGRCWRPAYWHRVGIPGSGGKQWLRADVEYVLAFTSCQAAIPWADNTANGHPPKWAPGGEMSYRNSEGTRRNQWGGSTTADKKGSGNMQADGKRDTRPRPSHRIVNAFGVRTDIAIGTRKHGNKKATETYRARSVPVGRKNGDVVHEDAYEPPVLANPGVLIQGIKVGGGLMGASESHQNEAPFPLKLAQWFIRSHCPPGGLVLDPFSGSGTTVHAALSLGRRGIGCDLRFSQCQLGRKRCREIQPELV